MAKTASNRYTELDAAILALIGTPAKPTMFGVIAATPAVKKHTEQIAEQDGVDAWRIVDRRLQVIRKAGRIRYQRKPEGWVLVTPPATGT